MDLKDRKFLIWLANRLVFKHGYGKEEAVIRKLVSLSSQNPINISSEDLDKIISKYYAGFFLEKTEDCNIGYNEDERNHIRTYVKSLIVDIINKNIPSQVIK